MDFHSIKLPFFLVSNVLLYQMDPKIAKKFFMRIIIEGTTVNVNCIQTTLWGYVLSIYSPLVSDTLWSLASDGVQHPWDAKPLVNL